MSPPERRLPAWASFEHRPAIDGIRAIAALLVVLFHAGMPGFAGGFAGVDVFFVLSGFLITSLLVREMWSRRRISLPDFYARRARRLLPAAITVLIITAVVYQLVASRVDVIDNRMSFIFAALYISNWYFLAQSQDYFAADASPSPVLHYWSLSVEEQFYIVWPVLALVLLIGLRRRPMRAAALLLGLAIVGTVVAGVIAISSPMTSYFATYARAYQLLLGGALAVFLIARERREAGGGPPARPTSWQRPAMIAAVAALAVLLVASTSLSAPLGPFWIGLISCVATLALLAGLEYGGASALAAALASRVPRLLGRYSYSIYLWHWPVIVIGGILGVLPVLWWLRVPLVLVATIGLAAATWWLIEGRAMRISLKTMRERTRLAAAGLGSAIAAAVACVLILNVPASVSEVVAETREEVTADIVPTRPVTTATSQARILVVGDSHAQMFIEALDSVATRQGWQLATVTRPACPWPDIRVTDPDTGTRLDCAAELRDPALAMAREFEPDLTLLISGSIVIRDVIASGELLEPDAPGWLDEVERGSASFLFQLAELSTNIVVMDPIPRTDEDMVRCLVDGGDETSCSLPAAVRDGETALTAMWARITDRPGMITVNLDEFICPGSICPAKDRGVITRRDKQHLTLRYAAAIIDDFVAELTRQGVDLRTGTITRPNAVQTPTNRPQAG